MTPAPASPQAADSGVAPDPRVRGIVLKTYREVLLDRFGEPGYRKVLDALPDDARASFGQMIIATEWYPNRHVVALYETIVRVHYHGDPVGIRELGKLSSKRDLGGVFKIFLVIVSPQYLLTKTAAMWNRYFDHGQAVVSEQRRGFARGRFEGVRSYSDAFWQEVLGSCMGAIEAAGGKNVEATILSGGRSADAEMETELRWA